LPRATRRRKRSLAKSPRTTKKKSEDPDFLDKRIYPSEQRRVAFAIESVCSDRDYSDSAPQGLAIAPGSPFLEILKKVTIESNYYQ
jgi:hypothetical protein